MRGRPGSPGFKAPRLRQAREALGLTVVSLADLVGVTRQTLSLYESGARTPGPEHLDKLALHLAMPREFFFCEPAGEDPAPVFYRSLAAATKTARGKAHQKSNWLQEASHRLEEFVELPVPDLPTLDLPPYPGAITVDMIEMMGAALRSSWGLQDGPIQDLIGAAERRGIVVSKFTMESNALDAFSQWPSDSRRPFVVLNAEKDSAARLRLDTAHELGHLLLHRHMEPALLRRPENVKLVERQAFRFATTLLLPADPFLDEVDVVSLDYLRVLKPAWGVSIGAMLYRLHDLEVVDDADAQRLWRLYAMRGYRQQEPLDDELKQEQPRLLASAVDAVGGPRALPNVLRGRISLPDRLCEELLGLPSGSISAPEAWPVARLRTSSPAGQEASGGGVVPFRQKG